MITGFDIEYRKLQDGCVVVPSSMMDEDSFLSLYVRQRQPNGGEEAEWLADAPKESYKHLQHFLKGFAAYYNIDMETEPEGV